MTHATDDLNVDNRSDVIWRSDTGALNFLYGSASGGFTQGSVLNWNPVNIVAGTGDFNGDGRGDILFSGGYSSQNGTLLISALNTLSAGFQPDWEAATLVPPGWSVVGTGDFNGDGKTDILLRNSDGRITDWTIGPADATIVDVPDAPFKPNTFSPNPGTAWHVASTGDFNGDGRDDILWRSDSGQLSDWLGQANGAFVVNDANAYTTVSTNWHVVGAGDFNGDGRSDILWRSDSGQISDWLGQANGGFSVNDANAFVGVPTTWHIADIGDFNGDGRSDILWRSDSGQVSDWLGQANGGFIINDANALTNVATTWHVEAPDIHWV